MNSQNSAELFETIGGPIAGALWSRSSFTRRIWRSISANRNAASPAWLPEFRDGRFYQRPTWMNAPRGPDVSPELRCILS
jgi:uncharacterized membrane protein